MTASSPSASPNLLQVLVVDDHDDSRELMSIFLRRLKVNVIEAHDGVEAIKMAYSHKPGLIFMDISMPLMDGIESIRQLKGVEVTRAIPIVVVSAHCGDPKMSKRALEAGCQQCVAKPIELSEIMAIVEKYKAEALDAETLNA